MTPAAHLPVGALSRRGLLLATVTATASLPLAACGFDPLPTPHEAAYCVDRDSLERRARVADLPLSYEENGRRQAFWMESSFARRVDGWLAWWGERSGRRADEVRSFGTWIDGAGECDSWHHAGRAFDLTSLRLDGSAVASARMDRILEVGEAERAGHLRAYWQLAASLHLHFRWVLTANYDDLHRNHIHVDDGAWTGAPYFSPDSPSQVKDLQSICTDLFGVQVPSTGVFDRQTRQAVSDVLERIGVGGDLRRDPEVWPALLEAAVEAGRP